LETYQIIAGFSDIKNELRIKASINKAFSELDLWFSLEEGVLYVHDYSDHAKSLALAAQNLTNKKWWIFLRKRTFGYLLIEQMLQKHVLEELIDELQELYSSHGFKRFNSR
jgi:hypothetical protein